VCVCVYRDIMFLMERGCRGFSFSSWLNLKSRSV